MWRVAVVSFASMTTACGTGAASSDASGAGGAAPEAACAAGEFALEGGGCLVAGVRSNGCAAGQVLDGASCRDAGIPESACAPGFDADGTGGCEPILPDAPCPDGAIALPGETTCTALAPCGAGPWGDIPVEASTQFVDAQFSGASDGSQASPWTTVQAAIDAAEDGAIVAIAEGSYAEDVVVVGKAVRLWGRCPALVSIAGSAASAAALVVDAGADTTEVRGLALTGASQGIEIRSSEGVVVDAVRVHDTAFRGVYVNGAMGAVSATMTRVLVERARRLGVWISGGDVISEGVVVRDVMPSSDGLYGDGFFIEQDASTRRPATVTIRGSVAERNHKVGVLVAGADVTLAGSVVRDTLVGDADIGRGVQVQDSAVGRRGSIAISGSVIERNVTCGVCVYGSDATMEHTVVRDTMPTTARGPGSGRGVNVEPSPMTLERGSVIVRSSVISGNHEIGLHVVTSDADVEAVIVRDTKVAGPIATGRGISIQATSGGRGKLVLAGSIVERAIEQGVTVIGSDADIDGILVRDTILGGDIQVGRAMTVSLDLHSSQRSAATIRSSVLDGSREVGLAVLGSDATVEATVVRETSPQAMDLLGDGLSVVRHGAAPASAFVLGSRIEGNVRAGLASFGASVRLGTTLLECNALSLAGELFAGADYSFEDVGGNACGCAGVSETCKVLTAGLAPPEPIEPVGSR